MRLVRLSANRSTFRTVQFNPKGLTLILGRRESASSHDASRTYNGVGKSLLISLLHFCLGSNTRPTLQAALPGWVFSLDFEIDGKAYNVQRSTDAQNTLNLNGEKIPVDKYRDMLGRRCFSLHESVPNLTFRSLIPYFIRPDKQAYIAPDVIHKSETPYQRLVRVAYLLGLDVTLVTRKHELIKQRERLKELRGNFEKDAVIRSYLTQGTDIEISVSELQEEINVIERGLQTFEVAENYHELKREADGVEQEIVRLRNEEHLLQMAVQQINVSLKQRPDISAQRIAALFEEAQHALPESVVRTMSEVAAFHEQLLAKRTLRLAHEKRDAELRLITLRDRIVQSNTELDRMLQYLDTHGALDEFVALTNRLAELRAIQERLSDYQKLVDEYARKIQETNVQLSNENLSTITYLQEIRPHLDEFLTRFRNYARHLYPKRSAGLVVTNNEGENQLRFNIEAKIQADASDGINEAKIFCFDMTILEGQQNHGMRCLVHDSRLFSDIDPRQRAGLFRTAWEMAEAQDYQYVATINEDQIEGMRAEFTPAEYDRIFTESMVLELTDADPSGKLLGIDVELTYDEK